VRASPSPQALREAGGLDFHDRQAVLGVENENLRYTETSIAKELGEPQRRDCLDSHGPVGTQGSTSNKRTTK